MFRLCWSYVVIRCLIHVCQSRAQSVGWQSFVHMAGSGLEFSPVDMQALLVAETMASSLRACTQACHMEVRCRTFDYDAQSLRCRLFEGDAAATGKLIASNSSSSTVGSIELVPYLFAARNQPCSACADSRYLACMNGTCQCPLNTYFDGSVCRSSQYGLGVYCEETSWCRAGFNYTCLPRKQCGRKFRFHQHSQETMNSL